MKQKIVNKAKQLWQWWKMRRLRVKVLLIVGVLVLVSIINKLTAPDTSVTVETVKRQTLARTVVASGKVVSATDLSLGFDTSDTVKSVSVAVGQKVKKGDTLVTLTNGEEQGAYTQARGALLAAQARYKKVLEGATNEEVALAQVNLDNAARDLENTKKTQDGLVEGARRKLYSEGLVAESTTGTTLTNTPTISGTYTGESGAYTLSIAALGSDFINYSGLENGTAKISTTIAQPLGTNGLSLLFPAGSSSGQGGSWKVRIPNTAAAAYVTNLNTYTQAQNTRNQAVASAQALVATRTAELNLKKAAARQSDIDAALADVVTAQAQVEQAGARLEKTILRAPADGTITKVDVKVGEITTPQKEIVVLQDVGNLYLEANVGEGNISTIALGQPVTVSYDAFPGSTYAATVSSIDPAATEDGTIINYKIKALITDTGTIRPGMTANMSIVTAEVADALTLPARAVTTTDGASSVLRITSTHGRRYKTTPTAVSLGLKGDGDVVQITTGLSEGDTVLWKPAK